MASPHMRARVRPPGLTGKILQQHGPRQARPMTQKKAPAPDPDAVPAPPEPRNMTPATQHPPLPAKARRCC